MKKRLIPLAVLAAAMASCSSDDVIEANPDPSGNALTFSIAVGHSRATETKIGNLGDFKIVAKGVHPHGNVYDNFLIGSTSNDVIDGEIAHKSNESDGNIWTLSRDVYWPTSIENALFWAYTCAKSGDDNTKILPSGTFSFDANSVKATGFSPEKAGLSTIPDDGVVADGRNQVDFVTAFTQSKRMINVPLNFGHVLSQIKIKAVSKDKLENDHRIVRIKGAWLVNTKDKADLKSGYEWNKDTESATHTLDWDAHSFKADSWSAYGSYYTTPRVLDSSTQDLLDHSLMLIPQTIEKWEGKSESTNANNKAFILLLCRVELKHSGKYHDGSQTSSDVAIYGDDHYHQLFPVDAKNEFKEEEYGFVCVPVGITFEMGKRYTFTLDICGKDSSAGIYPPETNGIDFKTLLPTNKTFTTNWNNSKELSVVERAATVKGVGEPVLDDPIKFTVSVSDWTDYTWMEGETEKTEIDLPLE